MLIISILKSFFGLYKGLSFGKTSNALRHWSATILHIQLILGITLYTQSPIIGYFWKNLELISMNTDGLFFGLIHMLLMLLAIAVVTIGSAKAKRATVSKDKFRIMATWFTVGLVLILVAIPWPFSPLANRPYLRFF